MNNKEETPIFICSCHSHDHQMQFYVLELTDEIKELATVTHLTTHKNIFKRILYAFKYIFGYKSRYGAWDEMLFKEEDIHQLRNFLNQNYPPQIDK